MPPQELLDHVPGDDVDVVVEVDVNLNFLKEMGLVSGQYMADLLRRPDLTPDEFLASRKKRRKWRTDAKTAAFFGYAYAR